MNTRAVNWAYSQVVGFPDVKLVLVMLASDANAEGRGNVMLRDLARWTEIDESKLPGILHTLENFGLLHASVDQSGVVRFRLDLSKPGARRR
jgi:hypothetical protein